MCSAWAFDWNKEKTVPISQTTNNNILAAAIRFNLFHFSSWFFFLEFVPLLLFCTATFIVCVCVRLSLMLSCKHSVPILLNWTSCNIPHKAIQKTNTFALQPIRVVYLVFHFNFGCAVGRRALPSDTSNPNYRNIFSLSSPYIFAAHSLCGNWVSITEQWYAKDRGREGDVWRGIESE